MASAVHALLRSVLLWLRSPLRDLPGPPSSNWLYGNVKEILEPESGDRAVVLERWAQTYGPVFKYKGFFNVDRIHTTDLKALNYILTHSEEFEKSEQTRRTLARSMGRGLLFVKGDDHRRQNPAFGLAHIRELTSVFVEKSLILRDKWASVLSSHPEDDAVCINVLEGLNKATLDIIGLAGFNYDIDALDVHGTGEQRELSTAFQRIFASGQRFPLIVIAKSFFPILRIIPDRGSRSATRTQQIMRRVGLKLIAQKKGALMREAAGKAAVERKDVVGKDLLTLLIKANMASDVSGSQKLSDEEVLALTCVYSFLIAGHETTSTATTWCLYALALHPDVQTKLRDELLTLRTDTPTMEELNGLTYLDCVVRESMRLYSPVPASERVATADVHVPLDVPFTDVHGRLHTSLKVPKGCYMDVPILVVNRSKSLWGEDANEFRPERWMHLPEAVSNIPGIWSHLLSFLGGAHACIGYRFSIVEMKALLYVLVRAFEYAPAVPVEEIIRKQTIVQRPMLRSAPHEGGRMPLLVKPYMRI
ncbi:cytochrome P450 [Trametes cingulata]|nr:cytochrome P450 [Trametes cingulata]